MAIVFLSDWPMIKGKSFGRDLPEKDVRYYLFG